ncbi:hypothetical protein [uncultured Psychroserpens sp.]|uniref:hypothetical protein n=1 Tax=uncultured Psychroserpens sp. TaxID=255436 RepID=UPI0026126272|nr:hypothetical protein [uncultured Psychroserpens sp.]
MKLQLYLILIMFLTFSYSFGQKSPYKKNLEPLKFIEGTFTNKISFPDDNKGWRKPIETRFIFKKIMKDMYIEGGGHIPFDSKFSPIFRMTFDYDEQNDIYRLVVLDDRYGFMDIYYGNWKENQLILSNETTGTQVVNEGNRVYGKLIITPLSKGRFEIIAKISQDKKTSWQNYMKMEFVPRTK